MLQSPKKFELREVPPTHVDVFVEHYDELRRWAMQFSEQDRPRAEDLLHDFFLHFTTSRPDLAAIDNLDGYLYVIMRNLHLSQVRRATRTHARTLSVIEFDTIDVSFWASDPRDRLRMQDELGAVCQYACIRKDSSKAGSVLILRFFHGYYPDEIARILCVTRPAVKERLRLARVEAKLYLEDPNRVTFIGDKDLKPVKLNVDPSTGDLRRELRKIIFSTVRGEHIDKGSLNKFYKSDDGGAPECGSLAHIASCPTCLDEINVLLEIPTLASRYAEDTVGKDPGKKGGGGGAGGGTGKMLDTYIRRSNDLYYHEPQELCISVNGHLQGSQRIASDKNEMTLVIDTTETPGFVEVFSEQGIRLLMLNVDPPPAGNAKQTARVDLSDGRTLDANLNFSGSFPSLQVSYCDPALATDAIEITDTGAALPEPGAVANGFLTAETPRHGEEVAGGAIGSATKRLVESIQNGFKFWLQPARFTAAFAALMIAALLIYQFTPVGRVSAAELLNKSAEFESAQLASKERVLHRTLDLEEYRDGRLFARRKIDIWHSAELGITARRMYDEQGKLTTGDWRNASGIQTIYQRGQAAKLQPLPEKRGTAVLFDDAWQLSLSAREFAALVNNGKDATVEERVSNYLIGYESKESSTPVIKAEIVLSKEDLHAIEQTFTVRYGEEVREYRMTEAAYEWRPSNAVAPVVFEPNVELTGKQSSSPYARSEMDTVSADGVVLPVANTNTNLTTPATVATAALEVEVIDLLNNAGAFMGEQVDVQRTVDGKIVVTALVETEKRKAELFDALGTVRNNPAIRIKIETVAEAQAREERKKKTSQAQNGAIVDSFEATENSSAVYNDLRKKFSESEARAFADQVLRRSQLARRHALAAKQLSDRFSLTDLASLTPTERGKWIALINGHAAKFAAEYESLERELKTVFPDIAGGGDGRSITSDKDLQSAIRELYNLSVACDEGLRGSFALFTNTAASAEVKTAKFWRALNNAAAVARSLQSAK